MQLQECLLGEASKIQFDYINLTKNCYLLMKMIRLEIARPLTIQDPIHNLDVDSLKPMSPYLVQQVFHEWKEIQNSTRRKDELTPQSPRLEVAAKVLKKYLGVKALVAASSAS